MSRSLDDLFEDYLAARRRPAAPVVPPPPVSRVRVAAPPPRVRTPPPPPRPRRLCACGGRLRSSQRFSCSMRCMGKQRSAKAAPRPVCPCGKPTPYLRQQYCSVACFMAARDHGVLSGRPRMPSAVQSEPFDFTVPTGKTYGLVSVIGVGRRGCRCRCVACEKNFTRATARLAAAARVGCGCFR